MSDSARGEKDCAALQLDNQIPVESHEAGAHGSQPTAADPNSAASELAYKRTEDKLRAVANHLERIATAYIESRHSQNGSAR